MKYINLIQFLNILKNNLMKKIEIVGLGKLLQVVHLPNLKKFFSIISWWIEKNY